VSQAGEVERECDVFVRYLAGAESTDYLRAKYTRAVELIPSLRTRPGFESRLLRFAGRGPFAARIADAYAALLAPDSVLRSRLVLLVALLESSPPYHEAIDRPPEGASVRELSGAIAAGLAGVLSLMAGLIVLLPLRLRTGRGD
jgi:hypothetical protein